MVSLLKMSLSLSSGSPTKFSIVSAPFGTARNDVKRTTLAFIFLFPAAALKRLTCGFNSIDSPFLPRSSRIRAYAQRNQRAVATAKMQKARDYNIYENSRHACSALSFSFSVYLSMRFTLFNIARFKCA